MRASMSAHRLRMHANFQIAAALVVYGLALVLILAGGYVGWRKIRPHCRRYGSTNYEDRASERKKFWGYE